MHGLGRKCQWPFSISFNPLISAIVACLTWWPGETYSTRLLVYSTFEAHVTESVKAVFAKEITNLALTPGRLILILQALEFLK